MNFYLRNIELHIDDALIEQAELILARQGLNKAVEIEKQLWMAKKTDRPAYEAEVQLNGKKVKDYSCDCSLYQKNNICKHITALLLDIRAQLKKRETLKTKKKASKKIPPRLTINSILQQVRAEDLSNFVRNYARSNQKFALALKARFAGNINTEDNTGKYKQLIESTLKTEGGAKGFIKSSRIRTVLNFFEAITGHAQDTISVKNYSETFAIIQAVFGKVNSIFHAFEDHSTALQIVDPFIKVLISLNEAIKAPDLKEAFEEFCRHKAFEDAIIKYELYEVFLELLIRNNKSPQENMQLLDLIQNVLKTEALKASDEVNFRYFQIILLNKMERYEELQSQINLTLSDFDIFEKVLEKLVDKKQFQLCYRLIDHTDFQQLTAEYQGRLNNWRLNLARIKNENKVIFELSRKRFLESLDFKYYEIFKTSLGRNKVKEITKLLKELTALSDSDQRNEAIAAIYQGEGKPQKLLDHLAQVSSLDLMQKFDHTLHATHKDQTQQLYLELLEEYLDDHIGNPASVTVRRLLQHLYKVNAGELARKLVYQLRNKYAWRRSLIEGLEIF